MAGVSYTSKLSEPNCYNWIKAALAVFITKEGMEPFVCKEIREFQWKCLSEICYNNAIQAGRVCTSCNTENVVVCLSDRKCNAGRGTCAYHRRNQTQYLTSGCPNSICHNFKHKIQAAHRYSGPSYKNTDARQWCTVPWEVAKCFMPPDGYKDKPSAKETDFNGIISVVINLTDFQAKISDDLSRRDNLFEKGREISRAVRHSPNLEVDDSDLQQYFSDLSSLLSDPGYLANDPDAQFAFRKLEQLQNDTLVIGKEEVRSVLDDIANAVKDKIRNEIDEQKKKAEEQKLELLIEMEKSVNAIKNQEKLSSSEVKSVLTDSLHAIDEKVKKGRERIKVEVQAGTKQIEFATDESVGMIRLEEQAVRSVVQAGTKQIEMATDESVEKIRLKEKAIGSVVQAGTKQIEIATDDSVGKIRLEEKATRSVVQAGTKQIEMATDDSVEKIRSEEKAIRSVVQAGTKQIEMATDDSVEKIRSEEKAIRSEVQAGTKRIEMVADDSVGKIRLEEKAVKSEGENLRAEIRAGRKLIETVTNESVRKIRSDAESEEITSDDNMRKLSKGLQNDLISYYKETCSTLPICPCLEEVDASLVEFYIPPYPLYSKETDILKWINIQRKQSEEKNTEEAKVDTLSGIFVKNSKDCRNIYITAEPGSGKTSLLKWLVLNWCQAHCPEDEKMEFFNENDVGYLRNFKFLFLVYLRGAAEKDDIDSMIHSQIIPFLGNKLRYTPKYLEDVLFKENCLIVMDGLDEWTSADKFVLIPKRSLREKSTYLTTSRPWKFSMLSLNSREIDQHIQIKSLTNMCTRRLVQSLFSIFKKKDCLQDNMQPEIAAQMFIKLLYKKNLADVLTTPLMLLQMGFVWNQKRQIGNSFCEIYTEMVDVLLTIAEKKNPGLEKFKKKMSTDLHCFKSSSCESYFDFMLKVGKLAYGTLCSEKAESTLVFEEAVAFNHLSGDISISAADILEVCLKIGVLSKEPLYSDAKRKRYTYSFQHTTIQEFFAAVFLQSMYERDSYTVEVLKRKCQSVAAVLEMGTVFKFLSGFNPKVAKKVLQSLQPVICRNTELYRMEMSAFSKLFRELKSWQNMVVSCVIESINNGQREQDFPLEDVIIDRSCYQDSYHSALNTLIKSSGPNIKSLFQFSFLTFSKAIELETIQSVVSLNVDTLESLIHMHHLLERSVQLLKCFKLRTLFAMNDLKDIYHSEAMKTLMTLKEAKQLVVLHIKDIQVNHDVLQTFLICISNSISLRDIKLNIPKMDPDRKCSDHKLDLRHHSHLEKLCLMNVPVSQLQLNDHLQNLTMRNVPISQLQLNVHLRNLTMGHVPVSQLQLNVHLQNLTMGHVPVSQLQLNVHLQNLTMGHVPVSQLQLNDHLQKLTMVNVPVSQLQLNDHLQNLTMKHVPVSQLQLNVHLQNLTMEHVPVSQLQLNDHLQNLTMGHVPVSQLQMNDHLQNLTMMHVPVSQLQLNVHLQNLTMEHVPVSQLQLNDHLQNLTMEHVPVSQLQLNDHLQNLTIQHVPVSQLQLNVHLQNLTMEHVPVSQLQLNDHLQNLTMKHVPVSQLQLNNHLQELTMIHVPVSQLQLNNHLQELTMIHVPVSQLQLNNHLQELTMGHVPVSQLQLNVHLQNLTMRHVPVSQLQLNDHLQNLTMVNVPVSQLQLNDHLQNLTMKRVPVSQLQLNVHLQNLTMEHVPVSQLQLNNHLQELTMIHVPVSQLQLNNQLQELTMVHVPVSQLQLNNQLQELTMEHVPVSQLQLNYQLQELTMVNVPVSQLQLNEQLQELTMEHVSVSQLQMNNQLQKINLSNVKISLNKADRASSLKSCNLRGDVGTVIRDLAAAPNLDRLILKKLTSESVMILLEILSFLLNVSEIYIIDTDIGNRHFVITPDMTHLQCVRLFNVSMTSEAFLEFIGSVLKCKNVIYTKLKNCRVRDVTSSAQMHTEQGVMSLSPSPKECISENGKKTFEVVLSHAGTSSRTLKDFVDMVQRSLSPVTVLLNKKEIDYFELIEYVRSSPFFTIQSEDDTSVTFMTNK